ncbi:MAG: hypothetical protein P8L44_22735 [Opitutales bacterium]|jgi:hypothetical protein|nr:hypothetical protein [Opitutales bacterium]
MLHQAVMGLKELDVEVSRSQSFVSQGQRMPTFTGYESGESPVYTGSIGVPADSNRNKVFPKN